MRITTSMVFLLVAGCANSVSTPASAPASQLASWYIQYMLKSPSVMAVKQQINKAGYRMALMEDEVSEDIAYITIGANTDLRFDNYLAVRIRRSGQVDVMDLTGEYVPDRPGLYPFTP